VAGSGAAQQAVGLYSTMIILHPIDPTLSAGVKLRLSIYRIDCRWQPWYD